MVFNPTPGSNVAPAGAVTVTTSVKPPFRSNSSLDPVLNVTRLLNVAVPMPSARPGLSVPSMLMAEVPVPVIDIDPAENTSVAVTPKFVVANPVVVRLPAVLVTEPRKSSVEGPEGPVMLMFPGDVMMPNLVVPVFVTAMLTAPAESMVTSPVAVVVLTLMGSDPVPMAPLDEV